MGEMLRMARAASAKRREYVQPVRVGRLALGSSVHMCPVSAGLYAMVMSGMLRRCAADAVHCHSWGLCESDPEDDDYCKEDADVLEKFQDIFTATYKGGWCDDGVGGGSEDVISVSDLGGYRTGPDDGPSLFGDAEVLLFHRPCATPFCGDNRMTAVTRPKELSDLADMLWSRFILRRRSFLHGHHCGVHDIGEMQSNVCMDAERACEAAGGVSLWECDLARQVSALEVPGNCHLCALVCIVDVMLADYEKKRESALFPNADRGFFIRARLVGSDGEDVLIYDAEQGSTNRERQLQSEFKVQFK